MLMMMFPAEGGLEARKQKVREDFERYPSWEDKYRYLIDLSKQLDPLTDEEKQDKFKVKGCQSQVWLVPSLGQERMFFKADSDALLVKGLVALMVHLYSGLTAQESLKLGPDFLKELGLLSHLSLNRSNGLFAMIKQIHLYAQVQLAQQKLKG